MTLVLTGLANGFRVEANDTVDDMGVDARSVRAAAGPFLGSSPFPEDDVARPHARRRHRRRPQVSRARRCAGRPTRTSTSSVRPHGPGMPAISRAAPDGRRRGRGLERARQGHRRPARDRFALADVVGVVDDSTALAGQPNVFLTIEGAQLMFAGQRSSRRSARGDRRAAGYQIVDQEDAVDDILRP